MAPPHFSIQVNKGSVRVLQPDPSQNGGCAMSSCSASEAGINKDSLKTGGGPEVGSRRDIKDGIAGVMSLWVWCSASSVEQDSD